MTMFEFYRETPELLVDLIVAAYIDGICSAGDDIPEEVIEQMGNMARNEYIKMLNQKMYNYYGVVG